MQRPVYPPKIVRLLPLSPTMVRLEWEYEPSPGVPVEGFFINYREATTAGEYTKVLYWSFCSFLFFNPLVDILIMYHCSDIISVSTILTSFRPRQHIISLLICVIYYQVTVLNPRRTYEISHLKPNVSYDFKIQCFNIAGTSDFSPIYKKSVAGKLLLAYCM